MWFNLGLRPLRDWVTLDPRIYRCSPGSGGSLSLRQGLKWMCGGGTEQGLGESWSGCRIGCGSHRGSKGIECLCVWAAGSRAGREDSEAGSTIRGFEAGWSRSSTVNTCWSTRIEAEGSNHAQSTGRNLARKGWRRKHENLGCILKLRWRNWEVVDLWKEFGMVEVVVSLTAHKLNEGMEYVFGE